ncbi:MAG: hypothetical protein KIS76_02460 [Pyrinomonadaceae bacterium]|nr:hypothetical protein [Pyrinomonadaceae bacterium]
MDSQTIVAAIIILLSLVYVGSLTYKKLSAFSSKKASCKTGCGCSAESESNLPK